MKKKGDHLFLFTIDSCLKPARPTIVHLQGPRLPHGEFHPSKLLAYASTLSYEIYTGSLLKGLLPSLRRKRLLFVDHKRI